MKRHFKNAERGQSLVEMSIGFVILTMILSGLLDLGRIWYIRVALEDAAGEAALYLSLDPICLDAADVRPDATLCTDPNNGMFRASFAVGQDVIDWVYVQTSMELQGNPIDTTGFTLIHVGDEITVQMTYPVQLLTPVIPYIAGVNPILLTARATQRVVRVYRPDETP